MATVQEITQTHNSESSGGQWWVKWQANDTMPQEEELWESVMGQMAGNDKNHMRENSVSLCDGSNSEK